MADAPLMWVVGALLSSSQAACVPSGGSVFACLLTQILHGGPLGMTLHTASTPEGESMHILQELLEPIPVHEFLHRAFTRAPVAMPDRARRYTQDFTEADIAAMVETGRSVLRIVRQGRLVHDQARLSWTEAQAYYRGGHTLLVRYAERSSAKCQALAEPSRSFHAPVDIQVYVTPDQQQAFGWHYDLEEVFIIQVQGCKEYTLRQNTVNPSVWDTMPADLGYERETSRLRMTSAGSRRLALHSVGLVAYCPDPGGLDAPLHWGDAGDATQTV